MDAANVTNAAKWTKLDGTENKIKKSKLEVAPPDPTMLPTEIWLHVLSYCDPNSILLLQTTASFFAGGWYNQCFPGLIPSAVFDYKDNAELSFFLDYPLMLTEFFACENTEEFRFKANQVLQTAEHVDKETNKIQAYKTLIKSSLQGAADTDAQIKQFQASVETATQGGGPTEIELPPEMVDSLIKTLGDVARSGDIQRLQILTNPALITIAGIINDEDDNGITPLSGAAANGRRKIIDLLLSNGAQFVVEGVQNALTPYHVGGDQVISVTPFHITALQSEEWARDIFKKFPDSLTHVFSDAYKERWSYIINNDHKRLKESLESGKFDATEEDRAGWNLLDWASLFGKVDCMSVLIDYIPVNAGEADVICPLDFACISGQLDAFKFLVSKGAKILVRWNGNTYLHSAAKNGDYSFVEYLNKELHMKADATNDFEKTPLFLAELKDVFLSPEKSAMKAKCVELLTNSMNTDPIT